MTFKKGYVQTPEHKEKIRQARIECWKKKKLLTDPEALGDSACSLCVEFSEPKDFKALKPNCRMGEGCVIRIIWSRFLTKFQRKKEIK